MEGKGRNFPKKAFLRGTQRSLRLRGKCILRNGLFAVEATRNDEPQHEHHVDLERYLNLQSVRNRFVPVILLI